MLGQWPTLGVLFKAENISMSLWRIPNTPKKAAILAITFCFSLTFPLVITTTGCKAVMFWMVARHGTQYPSSRDAFRMKDRLPKLRKTILQNHKERRGCNRIRLTFSTKDSLSSDFIWRSFRHVYRDALPTGYRRTEQQRKYPHRWRFRRKTDPNWPWRVTCFGSTFPRSLRRFL